MEFTGEVDCGKQGGTRLKAKLRILLGPKMVNYIKRMIKR